ncbi:hypothetical protein R5W24_004421 [Gemmata sp. JC717]|uniref:hypothetical protein n=1 Tax=Gemmata algarum TaxID=2975278 RepID=UPI0021BAAAF9|nr:hypothetical protein [Gemmata algarum]MDY3555280.1 hypothetical protein [Gemmata algarum]
MKAACIKCWNPDALVTMDLDGSALFRCSECEEEFTRDDVRGALEAVQRGWSRLLAWADAYPQAEPETTATT